MSRLLTPPVVRRLVIPVVAFFALLAAVTGLYAVSPLADFPFLYMRYIMMLIMVLATLAAYFAGRRESGLFFLWLAAIWLLACVLALDPADSDVEHRGARFDHVRGDDPGDTGGRDDDVRRTHLCRKVPRPRVAQDRRGVLAAPGEDQAERSTDGDPAPDDRDLGAPDRYVVAPEQLDAAHRCARQRARLPQHQPTEVDRVQAVDVLLGRVAGDHPGGGEARDLGRTIVNL